MLMFPGPYDEPEPEPDDAPDPILSGQPHPHEWTRDIPKNCRCVWEWNPRTRAYDLTGYGYGCPWHNAEEGA